MKPKPKPIKKIKPKKKYVKNGKKSARQILETQLDEAVRAIVFLRDGCCVCPAPERGHTVIRQPGHLITRGKMSIRWDLRNVHEQCSACNMRHSRPNQWVYYDTWFVGKFGGDERERLGRDGQESRKYSIEELEEMLGQLRLIYSYQLDDRTFKPRFAQKQILSGEWRALKAIPVFIKARDEAREEVDA